MWAMWFYHDTKNGVFYLSCFHFVYKKIFTQDHSAHFEALNDSCIYGQAICFVDDVKENVGEYNIDSVSTNCLVESF